MDQDLPSIPNCGHVFPFAERGLGKDANTSFVNVRFNIPACLYLDSERAGQSCLQFDGCFIDFKHIVDPCGRCGMPVKMDGVEIENDDKGNYSYTSVSLALPYDESQETADYIDRAIDITNRVIVAYRKIVDRPTISTLGRTDLSQGLAIEGPFRSIESFQNNSGCAGMSFGGEFADGTPMVSFKGFAANFVLCKPPHDHSIFAGIQRYLDGVDSISTSERLLHESERELKHGDYSFALVLAGSALEIGAQKYLDDKSWRVGRGDSFAQRYFQIPFEENEMPSLKDHDSSSYANVEKLYRTRNKIIHEGRSYFVGSDAGKGVDVLVGALMAAEFIASAKIALSWIESCP